MELIEFLSYGFIRRAIIAGVLIASLCSMLGVFLVLRRLSLIGDGLAHVTFGGVALGMLFKINPFYVAMPVVLLASLGILKISEKARVFGDAAIGIVSSLGIAVGVLIASTAGGFNVDLFSFLFGNILAISNEEVVISAVLSGGVIFSIVMLYHELLAVSFDEDLARVSGIKTDRINSLLVLLTALTVVLAMRVVGIMLVSALLILPAAAALNTAKGFKAAMAFSVLFGVVSVLAGIALSLVLNLPAGATIVVLNFLIFAIAFLVRKMAVRGALQA
jgi:zinc transport system permease protein